MMDSADEWISLREFARRAGVNVNAVSSALKSGRIERRDDDKRIHWPSQSEAWFADRDQSKVRGEVEEEDWDGEPSGNAFKKAQTRKEVAVAGLKELELQRERGEMVRASHVRSAMAEWAIDIREAVMSIPDRIASELAAELAKKYPGLDSETARELVHRLWRRESRQVLEKIAARER